MPASKGYSPSRGIWSHSQCSVIECVVSDVSPSVRACALSPSPPVCRSMALLSTCVRMRVIACMGAHSHVLCV